jgi:hypothetical protein
MRAAMHAVFYFAAHWLAVALSAPRTDNQVGYHAGKQL